MIPSARRRTLCLGLALASMAAGLVWRLALPGLSPFWFKYGGSALWAVMVYWIVASLGPRRSSRAVAFHAVALALGVELVRLLHTPGLDAFRLTLAGRLLLGRIFSVFDILTYWLAIGLTAWMDDSFRR